MKIKISIEIEAEIESAEEIRLIRKDKEGCVKGSISNLKEGIENDFFPCDIYGNNIKIDCKVDYIE